MKRTALMRRDHVAFAVDQLQLGQAQQKVRVVHVLCGTETVRQFPWSRSYIAMPTDAPMSAFGRYRGHRREARYGILRRNDQ